MVLLSEPADLRLARQSGSANVSDVARDEAFATVSVPERRCDSSHASRETLAETTQLANALREQLSSLDAQRQRLSRLLDGLNA